jgi:phage shock protein E
MAPRTFTLRAALSAAMLVMVLAMTSCASSEADGKVTTVGPGEAVTLIESGEYVVVDLRSAESFAAGHVTGARNIPFLGGAFKEELPDLDPRQRYLLYGQDPSAANRASDVMVALDFEYVVDAGRFGLLALAGAPVESSEPGGSG